MAVKNMMLTTGNIELKRRFEKMSLTKEEIKFIKDLSYEMKTQNNRGTAQPFCLMLEEEVERIIPEGFEDDFCIRWQDETYYRNDFDKLKNELLECFSDDKEIVEEVELFNSFEQIADWGNYNGVRPELQSFYYKREHEVISNTANFFLTEKAYNEHLRVNKHNLNNPRAYGVHLYRNLEMEELFKIVHKLADSL